MNEFNIFSFVDENYASVVFINSTEDVYFLVDKIFEEVSKTQGKTFSVLLDMFMRNGFSFNRFALYKFDDAKIIKSFIVNPRDVSENIKFFIKRYLKNNINLLLEAAVSRDVIEFIMA